MWIIFYSRTYLLIVFIINNILKLNNYYYFYYYCSSIIILIASLNGIFDTIKLSHYRNFYVNCIY